MYTISQLARHFGLSRSTLLYYDSIGLLKSNNRNNSGYRIYNEKSYAQLEKICTFRDLGLPLKDIKLLLKNPTGETSQLLEEHLINLSKEIRNLKRQQFAIVALLRKEKKVINSSLMNKEQWIKLLESTGLSDEDMRMWHIEFEKMAPEAHHDFLISLGIEEKEIGQIRKWAGESLR